MAKELVLMERGFDRMNVPGEKVQEYLAEGWKEISRKPIEAASAPKKKPAAPANSAPAEKKGKKK